MTTAKNKTEKNSRDIGIVVTPPPTTCDDRHCPFHGELKVRGRIFIGTAIRSVFHKSTIIEFPRKFYLPKFERFEKRRSRIPIHIPPMNNISKGDTGQGMESKAIPKTKNLVAVEVMKP